MNRPPHITELHVERGSQMRELVELDVVQKGLTVEQSIESLSRFLGIDVESVRLGVAIANEWAPHVRA